MKKFLFTIPISFLFGLLAFHFSISDSYAMATTSSELIWGAFSIASEYLINHAGQTISGADYGLSDINDPFTASDSFGLAYGKSQGINFTGNSSSSLGAQVIENGRVSTVDVSTMPTTAYASMMSKLVPDYDGSDSYYVEALKLGGITLVYAVEKTTHELVAEGWSNVMAKFDTLTQTDINNIDSSLSTSYDAANIVFSKEIYLSNTYVRNDVTYSYSYKFLTSSPIFYYTELYSNTVGSSQRYLVHCVHPTGITGSYSFYQNNTSSTGALTFRNSSIFGTYGGITYYDDIVEGGGNWFTDIPFASQSDIANYLTEYGDSIPKFATELVDSSFLPYTVPSLRDTATTIGDIYPALQGIREGILTVPAVDALATSIPANKADSIADAIADAIAIGISIPDVKEDDEPAPDDTVPEEPIELPDWIVPSFFPDLLPIDMFTLFQPVMDIVGTSYSVYGLWIGLPAVLIFILILYIIVSVL